MQPDSFQVLRRNGDQIEKRILFKTLVLRKFSRSSELQAYPIEVAVSMNNLKECVAAIFQIGEPSNR